MQTNHRKVEKRALVNLFMFFSFIVLVPSGILVHFAAQSPSSVLHHVVMSVHNTAALIFVAAGVMHLSLVWRSIVGCIVAKAGLIFRREAVIAALLTGILILIVGSHGFHAR